VTAEEMASAHFRVACVTQGLGWHLDQDHQFEFNFSRPRTAVVRLMREPSFPVNSTSAPAICTSACEAKIPAAVVTKLATPFKDDIAALASLTPPELAAIDDVIADLRFLLKSTIDVFRWRHGLPDGPADAVGPLEAFFYGDGKTWLKVYLARRLVIGVGFTYKKSLKDVPDAEFVRLVEAGVDEPVAHQLFREAWALRRSNPRSALAIGMTAAEVGLKQLIATLVPNARWLTEEVPSPPIAKILRKYIATLPVKAYFRDKPLTPPKALITQIEKGVNARNKLLHVGKAPPNHDDLDEILRAVNDVLWICDLYAGEAWAGRHVSGNTIADWS
jgi:hypothetical protein